MRRQRQPSLNTPANRILIEFRRTCKKLVEFCYFISQTDVRSYPCKVICCSDVVCLYKRSRSSGWEEMWSMTILLFLAGECYLSKNVTHLPILACLRLQSSRYAWVSSEGHILALSNVFYSAFLSAMSTLVMAMLVWGGRKRAKILASMDSDMNLLLCARKYTGNHFFFLLMLINDEKTVAEVAHWSWSCMKI